MIDKPSLIQLILIGILLSFYGYLILRHILSFFKKYLSKTRPPSKETLEFFRDSLGYGEYVGEQTGSISLSKGLGSNTKLYDHNSIINAIHAMDKNNIDAIRKRNKDYTTDIKPFYNISFDVNSVGNRISIDRDDLTLLNIRHIRIDHKDIREFVISNINIPSLSIGVNSTEINIQFKNCNIGTLIIDGVSSIKHLTRNFIIDKTHIGTLTLKEFCAHNFNMTDGSILNIECPNANESSPFIGDVTFKNVFFPIENIQLIKRFTVQGYRNMRHHLYKLENIPVSNMFQSLELQAESKTDPKFERFLNKGYGFISGHGSKPFWPLFIYFSFLLVFIIIYSFFDAAEPALKEKDYKGWQTCIYEQPLCRNMTLAFQQSIGPLKMLSSSGLVIPKSPIYYFLGLLYSVFSTITIVLFIFAVRRRFRVHP